MFALAYFLGFFSYLIFFLGLFHLLYPSILISVTSTFILGFGLLIRERIFRAITAITIAPYSLAGVLVVLITLQAFVNCIGAFGPELGFDALWYHLTLPKLYLAHHHIVHISQNLFYYSDMPKLIEMLYVPLLATGNAILPKLLHFMFGILCCLGIYFLARRYTSKTIALIAVAIFYSNLVVGWESISGYIDLGRTFFEILALWAFINWSESDNVFWLLTTAAMTGFAITSKFLGFGTLVIFFVLIIVRSIIKKQSVSQIITRLSIFLFVSLLIPLPWMIFSWVHTGNPVYPFFSPAYPISPGGTPSVVNIFSDIWTLFTASADPISPLYLAFLPLIVINVKKANSSLRYVYAYSVLALLVWYLAPRTGGGRFILPYLPAFSLLAAWVIQTANKHIRLILICCVLFISSISIVYRAGANAKFIPVLTRQQTTTQFLSQRLNFSFGDFYDTNGFFAKHITSDDLVLLEGFHNIFYVNFPFTFNNKDKNITYIAVQGTGKVPAQFSSWKEIENNPITHVRVYHE